MTKNVVLVILNIPYSALVHSKAKELIIMRMNSFFCYPAKLFPMDFQFLQQIIVWGKLM